MTPRAENTPSRNKDQPKIVRPAPRHEVRFQSDRPSAHYYREAARRRGTQGWVRLCDLISAEMRDLLTKGGRQ